MRDANVAQDVVREAFLENWWGADSDATRFTHPRRLPTLTHGQMTSCTSPSESDIQPQPATGHCLTVT